MLPSDIINMSGTDLFDCNRRVIARLREEAKCLVDSKDTRNIKVLENYRNLQIDLVEHDLGVSQMEASENVEEHIRQYSRYIYMIM